jgi:hypothetical protein
MAGLFPDREIEFSPPCEAIKKLSLSFDVPEPLKKGEETEFFNRGWTKKYSLS